MRQAIEGVDGVLDAEVWYDEKRADVRYDPERATPAAMVVAIDGAGFSGSVIEDDADVS